MNISIIRRILGYVLLLEAALLLIPCLVGLAFRERECFAYLITAAICLAVGSVIGYKKQFFILKTVALQLL